MPWPSCNGRAKAPLDPKTRAAEVFTSIPLPKPVAPERLPIYYGPRPALRPKQRESRPSSKPKPRRAAAQTKRREKPTLESRGVPARRCRSGRVDRFWRRCGRKGRTPALQSGQRSLGSSRGGHERQEQEPALSPLALARGPPRSLCPLSLYKTLALLEAPWYSTLYQTITRCCAVGGG